MVPRPMGEVVHGKSVGEGVHLDFLDVGVGGPLGTKGVGKDIYQYLMVIVDDMSSFVKMEKAAICPAEVVVRTLLRWCSMIGVPRA